MVTTRPDLRTAWNIGEDRAAAASGRRPGRDVVTGRGSRYRHRLAGSLRLLASLAGAAALVALVTRLGPAGRAVGLLAAMAALGAAAILWGVDSRDGRDWTEPPQG